MIITRSPLRITLGGGGTDLPSYYNEHGGMVISAAIDKYVYVTLNRSFRSKISLKYFKQEEVDTIDEIEHPVIRECLRFTDVTDSIDIANLSDIPAGTGLGSSGSFTTALLKALHVYKREDITAAQLAEEAFHIEAVVLKQSVGRQDQYIAAVGGVTCFDFENKKFKGHLGVKEVRYRSLSLPPETMANLEDGILLFFTGYTRSASDILKDQDVKSSQKDEAMIDNLNMVMSLGIQSKIALESDNLLKFADLMNTHWIHKKERSKGMSNTHIDDLYNLAMGNGAVGGKLVGAGGGGFLMFYSEDKVRLRRAMTGVGLQEVRIRFAWEGTSVMAHV